MKTSKGLTAARSYLEASPEVVAQVVNGCGPGGWKFDIIPDTMYGLSFKEVCDIHDWDYALGKTKADKEKADLRFLHNCLALIEHTQGFWASLLRPLRRRRALKYYEAVVTCGNSAFWANKGGAPA